MITVRLMGMFPWLVVLTLSLNRKQVEEAQCNPGWSLHHHVLDNLEVINEAVSTPAQVRREEHPKDVIL